MSSLICPQGYAWLGSHGDMSIFFQTLIDVELGDGCYWWFSSRLKKSRLSIWNCKVFWPAGTGTFFSGWKDSEKRLKYAGVIYERIWAVEVFNLLLCLLCRRPAWISSITAANRPSISQFPTHRKIKYEYVGKRLCLPAKSDVPQGSGYHVTSRSCSRHIASRSPMTIWRSYRGRFGIAFVLWGL